VVREWTGDFVNLFAVFPSGSAGRTLSGFTQALINAGRMEVTHAVLGTVLAALAIAVLFTAFRFNASRGVRICSFLGFLAVLSAAYAAYPLLCQDFRTMAALPRWVAVLLVPTHLIFLCSISTRAEAFSDLLV
jgi:hypothetical protein